MQNILRIDVFEYQVNVYLPNGKYIAQVWHTTSKYSSMRAFVKACRISTINVVELVCAILQTDTEVEGDVLQGVIWRYNKFEGKK